MSVTHPPSSSSAPFSTLYYIMSSCFLRCLSPILSPLRAPCFLLVRLLERFPVFCILICAIAPYFRSLFYSEWYIDELFAIVRNEDAKNESSWAAVFSHDFWGNPLWQKGHWTHKSYRPLTVLSYCLEFFMMSGDIKPQPLRAFSTWLHAFNSVTLYFLVLKFRRIAVYGAGGRVGNAAAPVGDVSSWGESSESAGQNLVEMSGSGGGSSRLFEGRNRWAIALACCLFAAHPVHVENVVYLVGRADMMSAGIWYESGFSDESDMMSPSAT